MTEKKGDVGFFEDFLFTISNLYAVESHCISSYGVTKNNDQLEIAMKARKTRSDLLFRHLKPSKDQIWCEVKHCSGIVMGLKELANRYYTSGEKELAEETLQEASMWEAVFVLLMEGEK